MLILQFATVIGWSSITRGSDVCRLAKYSSMIGQGCVISGPDHSWSLNTAVCASIWYFVLSAMTSDK